MVGGEISEREKCLMILYCRREWMDGWMVDSVMDQHSV